MKIDVRVKIYIVVTMSTLAVIKEGISLLLVYIITLVLCLLFGTKLKRYLKMSSNMLMFLLPLVIIQSVFTKGDVLISIYNINLLTKEGLYYGFNFIFRILNITALGFILRDIPSREMIQGLVKLKIPYEFAVMTNIGISFLNVLRIEAVDTYNSLSLRGINFKKLKFNKKLDVMIYLIVPLLNSTMKKAKDLTESMELRGFRLSEKRTNYKLIKMRGKDYAFILTNTLVLVLFILY